MPSHHLRAKDVFLAALERPTSERRAFVVDACGDNDTLRQEVESLLTVHEAAPESETPGGSTDIRVPEFPPGALFAGRYRMISRIGRGGMGDVWRADDLVLGTRVALKLILSQGAEGRERLMNEARLARQITHPNVCRVFDVGEAEGWAFLSMELVDGEDLAALLRRVGRLPSEKVVDIARQLCDGLTAAHARFVLHRDLKPSNVLIDDDGVVRILDFGIAIPRTDASRHARTGTPGYMAPEQQTPGGQLSERTDVYSLGLLMYELLAGRHALSLIDEATGLPPAPSTIVPNVDTRLERIIMQALARDPAKRPESALAVAAALPALAPRVPAGAADVERDVTRRGTWWLISAAAVLLIGAAAVAYSFIVSPGTSTLTERDTIVLADFENATGDKVFDGTLKVALAVALEQSPFLRVFPDSRARDTLRLMERTPDEPITRNLARDIARREQLKAMIAGSIVSLGRNYVIGLEAVNAATGEVMAREQSEAARKEDVLEALGTASKRLRERLGESLASVEKFDVALPRATTQSLDALHAYSLALEEGREVPRIEAIPHLKRAIELDPTFAMAFAQLSSVYTNTGQSTLAPEYSRRAFELRDRVSERERYSISWRFYRDAAQDWERALDLTKAWTAAYPRDAFAFNAFGAALIRLGQFEQSADAFRKAIELDPRFTPAYSNLSAALLGINRYDEARAILKQAADRQLTFLGARRLSYLIAFVQGDRETMAKELASSTSVTGTNAAFGWQGHAAAFEGRMNEAHEQFSRGVQMATQGNFPEVASQLETEDAEARATVGRCAGVQEAVAHATALSKNNITLERGSRALALCGDSSGVARLTAELAKRFPEATLTIKVAIPIANAAQALVAHEPQKALQLLEPVKPFNRAPNSEFWPAYLRGQAYLELKDTAAAQREFKSIIDRRGEVPAVPQYPLAYLGLARSARLAGDSAAARESYQRFLELWKDADADLRQLKDARAELERLP